MGAKKVKADDEWSQFWIETGIDITKRRIMLAGHIKRKTTIPLISAIQLMADEDISKPIHVYISSDGGFCSYGFALYETLINCGAPIFTYGIGAIESMATVIMLAGDERFCYPTTTFMWHLPTVDLGTESVDTATNNLKGLKLSEKSLLNIYDERSSKPASFWKKWLKGIDRHGGADKAVELGFVNTIITKKKK